MSRRAEGTRICGHLCEAVAKLAPPGIGERDDVWEAVAPATDGFMALLQAWERTGNEADKQRLRDSYRALLDAWRNALSDTRPLTSDGHRG